MKRIFVLLFVFIIVLSTINFLGCANEVALPTTHSANARFGFKEANGTGNFDSDVIYFDVGKDIAMKLDVTAISSDDICYPVDLTLTIPRSKHVDAKCISGTAPINPQTPNEDIQTQNLVYKFKINTNEPIQDKWKYLFLFIPNAEGDFEMTLEYGDPIPANHSQSRTLIFKNPAQENEQQ